MPAISYARITILGALVTVLLAAFFLATRGLNLAVDLTGGTIIEVHYPEAVASNSVQTALVMAGVTDTKVSGLSAYPLNLFGHGRDGCYQPPPAQIPACAANAPGSPLGFWRRSGDMAVGVVS
jgi:hypothetical protein